MEELKNVPLFKKDGLSLYTLVSIAIGTVVGSGVVALIGPAIAMTGRSAGIAYGLAVIFGFANLVPCLLIGSTLNVPGGEYSMVQAMLGRAVSGVYIWNFIITHVALSTTALALGTYINALWPQVDIHLAAFVSVTFFYIINLFGLHVMSRIQNIIVVLLMAGLLMFCVLGSANLYPGAWDFSSPDYFLGGVSGFMSAVVLFSSSTNSHQLLFGLGGEVRKSRSKLPKAIYITSGIILLLYSWVGFVGANVLPLSETIGKTLVVTAWHIMPPWLFVIFMIVGPIFAITSTFNGIFPTVSKALQNAAKDGWFPKIMAKENRFGAAYGFLTILYLVASIPILLRFNIPQAVSLMLVVINVNKIVVFISAAIMPKKHPDLWKQSIVYMRPFPYYITLALCLMIQLFTIYMSMRNLGWQIVFAALSAMAVLGGCSQIFYRSGRVKITISVADATRADIGG